MTSPLRILHLEDNVGALWRVDREVGELGCVEVWHIAAADVPQFETASRQLTFPPGIGLPSRLVCAGAHLHSRRGPGFQLPAVFMFPTLLGMLIAGCWHSDLFPMN